MLRNFGVANSLLPTRFFSDRIKLSANSQAIF